MKDKSLAPICLFAYNRPQHLKLTLESLSKNVWADKSELYIYFDGPKNNASQEDRAIIEQLRKFAKDKPWCKKVNYIFSENNKGLSKSVISGVSEVINKHQKIIVLEDDMVLSKYFLVFMNQALNYYAEEERVAGIHGYSFATDNPLPTNYFLKDPGCWGWATWQRAWSLLNPDGLELQSELQRRKMEYEFDYDGSHPYTQMLKDQINGIVDSWAIRWYASLFLQNKLALFPGQSLVHNIGNDWSGVHSGSTSVYDVNLAKNQIPILKIPVEISHDAREEIIKYFQSIKPKSKNLITKLIDRVRNNYVKKSI